MLTVQCELVSGLGGACPNPGSAYPRVVATRPGRLAAASLAECESSSAPSELDTAPSIIVRGSHTLSARFSSGDHGAVKIAHPTVLAEA